MNILNNADVPTRKLTHYLLALRFRNDKSKFLAQRGFTAANYKALDSAS